ncbi:maleylacetoacetate isomerase [Aestuariispira insulae]|uniref:Maleylacetoacetate isomerase/maleylpyruvate isomerase n=1 Tax=Aestuariispira insulae TaxID=1461337 RepID=A0A3D9H8G4_9PROT|nr:maleylacetoacetate isomerase [Aestuariispira insulae]RED45765.1 maleylacetoacetate isomerase/maleylpyruvate isomerase [Aestuariispira insulae]
MKLYTYWRSSAAYRVRIALNLKGIAYEEAFVHLVRDGGDHLKAAYAALNPQKLVPSLELEDGTVLTQSLAMIDYLEETHPTPALLPDQAVGRARVRGLAQQIACDIHPVNNLRILKYLTGEMGLSDADKTTWYRHWVEVGFEALENSLANSTETGRFCHGDQPGLADCCLVPQVYNARRFDVDMARYPVLAGIDAACLELEAFRQASPEEQGDAA